MWGPGGCDVSFHARSELTLAGFGRFRRAGRTVFFLLGYRHTLFVKSQGAVLRQAVELFLELLFKLS